jgi:hypothetical protein
VAGVYFSPACSDADVCLTLTEITEERSVDYLYGDVNVDFGQMVGGIGDIKPLERGETVLHWMARQEMDFLLTNEWTSAKLDHVFMSRKVPQGFSSLEITRKEELKEMGLKTDHPLLTVQHPVGNGHQDGGEEKGIERFRISKLKIDEIAQKYRKGFAKRAAEMEVTASILWESAKNAGGDERRRIVDDFHSQLLRAIDENAREVLGTYFASEARNLPDDAARHLEMSNSAADSIRLFRRSRRGFQPRIVPSRMGRTAMVESVARYRKVFGSEEEEPRKDEEEDELEWDASGGELNGLFTEEKLVKVIRRYGQHKSPGIDSIHINLLSALCPPTENEKIKAQELNRRTRSPAPSPPPPESWFLIPTQPTPLNPRARPFVPPRPSKEDAPDFPFPRLLSSLFRLCAATGYTPSQWGKTVVALISKLKTKENPTPADTRPIALLPMFRRLFEILLLPHFDPLGHSWAALDPRQAGFRSGWSCSTSILQVQHEAKQNFPCIAFLDFSSAYDLPPPRLIYRRLQQLQVPAATRSLVWSLLTSGSSISLVVNGQQSESFPRRRGFPQGAPLSPILFNLYLNSLLVKLNSHKQKISISFNPSSSPPSPSSLVSSFDSLSFRNTEKQTQTENNKEKEKQTNNKNQQLPLQTSDNSSPSLSQTSPLSPQDQDSEITQNKQSKSLVVKLAGAWAYADDLAVGTKNGRIMRTVLNEAEEWAKEWGMKFNSKKCKLVGRTESEGEELVGIKIGGETLEVVKKFKYLGIWRSGSEILWKDYIRDKVESMNGLLKSLQAAGGNWSPLVRLSIYRTYCRSIIEFGGPILYTYIKASSQEYQTKEVLLLLQQHHDLASTWTVGISNTSGNHRLAISMTGLTPPLLRLRDLALGLACFLRSSPPENPTSAQFLSEHFSPFPLESQYLFHLSHLPALLNLLEHNRKQSSEQLPSVTHQTFARQDLLIRCLKHYGLRASYIHNCNRPRGLVDGVLYISSSSHRRAAIRWRANTFGIGLRCLACGVGFTRRCLVHIFIYAPLINADGLEITTVVRQKIEKEFQGYINARKNVGRKNGTYSVMDFLLGHNNLEFSEIGISTLYNWEERMKKLAVLQNSFRIH